MSLHKLRNSSAAAQAGLQGSHWLNLTHPWPTAIPALRYSHPLARLGCSDSLAFLGGPKQQADGKSASERADLGQRMARLEAVLFLAKEPLNTRKLSRYANLADGTQARTLVGQLNQLYDGTGRAFRVDEVAGGFQLRTRPAFSRWLRRTPYVPEETRLSAPAMETLAVVAYRQPVVRADIESIRGVACGELLRQLMERELVRVSGRSDELGRPYFYSTTKRFLEVFGLRNLDELPRADEFRLALASEVKATGIVETNDDTSNPVSIPRAEDDDWDVDDDDDWDDDDDDDDDEGDEDGDDDWDDDEGDEEWEEVDDEELEEELDDDDDDWEEEWEEGDDEGFEDDDDSDEYEDDDEWGEEEDEEEEWE